MREENYTIHGCVKPFKPNRGCPRLLTGDMIDDIQRLLCKDPSLLLDEIKEWLTFYHDQPISTTALHLNLRDLALTHNVSSALQLNGMMPITQNGF